jgi:hypothetical protein
MAETTAQLLASENWFRDQLRKIVGAKAEQMYTKGDYRVIQPGSLVLFKYPNPKTPLSILKFFDANPLDIIFRIKGRHMWCINLHYLPRPARLMVMQFIIKLNRNNVKENKRLELDYLLIKSFLKSNGFDKLCVKQYLINRISGLTYIPYKEWRSAAYVPSEKFVFDGKYSEDELQKLIRSSTQKVRQSKNIHR